MTSILQKLTEGSTFHNRRKEGAALRTKWEETGLLEGLKSDRDRDNMSLMLENQALELLREASSMAAGDVEGFAAVAFPLVRRVFGGLIANEFVSIQPMDKPSGLIFFLDFQHNSTRLNATANDSVYGGGRLGAAITGGVNLTGSNIEKSFYNMNNGYSSPTSSVSVTYTVRASGTVGAAQSELNTYTGEAAYFNLRDNLVRYDADLASGTVVSIFTAATSAFTNLNLRNLVAITPTLGQGRLQRRLTRVDPNDATRLLFVSAATASENALVLASGSGGALTTTFPVTDVINAGPSVGSVLGATPWGLEGVADIPEVDINVSSSPVNSETKKLKVRWTQELQQDIQAYHNLDAEVELTSLLSEHVALEIDQEILEDLIKGATAGTYYWSRRPGKFLNRTDGTIISSQANESIMGADFTGNVSQWYETLMETINDVSAQIHRKTLRGGANFLVCGPEVANIMEMTQGFRASVTHDEDRGEAGTVKIGSINKKWDIYVDPYFIRNLILIGRQGKTFLESGYAFCPYVPLQVTPTLYGTDDFTPRKGVMTRFAKKMVRPDFYGLCVVLDMTG